ncbi:hypothetical protein Droror1_Dr00002030 [Drosera rotundifolia]
MTPFGVAQQHQRTGPMNELNRPKTKSKSLLEENPSAFPLFLPEYHHVYLELGEASGDIPLFVFHHKLSEKKSREVESGTLGAQSVLRSWWLLALGQMVVGLV